MATPKGSLLQHLGYGVDLPVGKSIADLDIVDVAKSIRGFVATDSAFTGVSSIGIIQDGPGIKIATTVGVRGVSNNIPVVTTVR
jgi:hypothetical protein